ncbi:hypothetical protein ACOMCU_01030 [Lysinibacillus sp. UGB7]|uniref:hypothetical protein n=1 Tax=Lysinibacillus sp. UGB7 TaxID=3411039 RepID=UPI003B7C8105
MKQQTIQETIKSLHYSSKGRPSFFKSVANLKIGSRKKVLQSMNKFLVEMVQCKNIRKELAETSNDEFKNLQRFANWIIADYEKNMKYRELDELDYQINWYALRIRHITYKKVLDVTMEQLQARTEEMKNIIQHYRGQLRY